MAEFQPEPLRLSRVFYAPRDLVFKAWSSAEHVKQWFCPTGFTAPEAIVDMRVGGAFAVCMRGPDGTDHWARGVFMEVAPIDRLVIDLHAIDDDGLPLFRAYTEVTFANTPGGTRMDVLQTYTLLKPQKAAPMVQGAPFGWAQTLDKLAAEIARMQQTAPTQRSVVHGAFHLKRTYDAPVERVYHALSDETAKLKWFGGEEGKWQAIERYMDFRVGGRERAKGRWEGGLVSTFDAIYHDIIPNERIVYSYEMCLDDRKISVSLATMQLKSEGPSRTTLMVSEQGAFLDGYSDDGSREHGTGFLLDRLGASLGL